MEDPFKVTFGFFVPTANFLLFGFIIYSMFQFVSLLSPKEKISSQASSKDNAADPENL